MHVHVPRQEGYDAKDRTNHETTQKKTSPRH
jgi:hypothetical protein